MGIGKSVLVKALYNPKHAQYLQDAFDSLDKDKSGSIDVDEWKRFGRTVMRILSDEKLKDNELPAFDAYAHSEYEKEHQWDERAEKDEAHPSRKDIDDFISDTMSKVDMNKDGKISFEEFKNYVFELHREIVAHAIVRALEHPHSSLSLREAFVNLDSDKNDLLDRTEFDAFGHEMFKFDHAGQYLGKAPSPDLVKTYITALWMDLDRDSSGSVSWPEFLEWVSRRSKARIANEKQKANQASAQADPKDKKQDPKKDDLKDPKKDEAKKEEKIEDPKKDEAKDKDPKAKEDKKEDPKKGEEKASDPQDPKDPKEHKEHHHHHHHHRKEHKDPQEHKEGAEKKVDEVADKK